MYWDDPADCDANSNYSTGKLENKGGNNLAKQKSPLRKQLDILRAHARVLQSDLPDSKKDFKEAQEGVEDICAELIPILNELINLNNLEVCVGAQNLHIKSVCMNGPLLELSIEQVKKDEKEGQATA